MAASGTESAISFAESDKLAAACRADGLVSLQISRSDGVLVAEGELDLPLAIIGRGPECSIQLNDSQISLRHAFLQVYNGHVLIANLGSKVGVSDGRTHLPFVWMSPSAPVHIGPFRLLLSRPTSDQPEPKVFNPFQPLPPDLMPKILRFGLRFVNGRTARQEWTVNRGLTLVGRSAECKINLGADDVDLYHCYFVLTPMGLWVVDLLSGRPVVVNGEPVQFARLQDGDIIEIARFKLQCFSRADNAATKKQATAAVLAPIPVISKPAKVNGVDSDSAELNRLDKGPVQPAATALATIDPALQPVIKQLEHAQQNMLEQFQHSMMQMMQMFGTMQQEQLGTMQQEVTRLAELTTELQKLQAQLVIPALTLPEHHNPLPDPDSVPHMTEESAAQHQWIQERVAKLNQERQSIWERLSGLMARSASS